MVISDVTAYLQSLREPAVAAFDLSADGNVLVSPGSRIRQDHSVGGSSVLHIDQRNENPLLPIEPLRTLEGGYEERRHTKRWTAAAPWLDVCWKVLLALYSKNDNISSLFGSKPYKHLHICSSENLRLYNTKGFRHDVPEGITGVCLAMRDAYTDL